MLELELRTRELSATLAERERLPGVDRMEALIDGLLAYARLGGELSRASVDLSAAMAEVTEDLAPALAGATLTVGPLPTVGDPQDGGSRSSTTAWASRPTSGSGSSSRSCACTRRSPAPGSASRQFAVVEAHEAWRRPTAAAPPRGSSCRTEPGSG
ncbi:hypothetical protein GCM10009844_26020 [Nocardioides koreensis]|uniref:Uncharacterized protein n=1 Tax=Nocardioides koreensis TaxID=433651 RepID=A0ABP5LIP9_9ACTN